MLLFLRTVLAVFLCAALAFVSCTQPDNPIPDPPIDTTTPTTGVGGKEHTPPVDAGRPTIDTQPQGGTWDVMEAETFTLSFMAIVTDDGIPSYQWHRTTAATAAAGTVVGTGQTLTLNSSDYPANGTFYFYVVITNTIYDNGDGGNKTASVTSNVTTVNVMGNTVDSPTPDGSIAIYVSEDMEKIGVESGYPLWETYTLMDNITIANWTPIGDIDNPFTGSFNGNGKTITINGFNQNTLDAGETSIGIFGYVKGASSALPVKINNLTINASVNDSSDVTGGSGQAIGLVTGYAENALIDNITLSGNFNYYSHKTLYAGGVVGILMGDATVVTNKTVVTNSNSTLTMNIIPGNSASLLTSALVGHNVLSYSYIGGFVGAFDNKAGIENCHNTGSIDANNSLNSIAQAQIFVGGITGGSGYSANVGYKGYVIDSSSTGNISANSRGSWTFSGGIAGTITGGIDGDDAASTRIVSCWASGEIYGTAPFPYVGGIVGCNYYGALVSQSYFTGTVKTDTANDYTGGIAGYNSQAAAPHNSRVEDCWSSGLVQGFNNAGGIVGQNQVNAFIRRCYSTAIVFTTNNAVNVGGIAGLFVDANAITDCVDMTRREE